MTERQRKKKEPLGLPDTVDLVSVDAAEVALIRLASEHRLTPREALYFSWMLEHRRRAIGDVTLEEQMRGLEKRRQRRERKP